MNQYLRTLVSQYTNLFVVTKYIGIQLGSWLNQD